MCKNANFKLSFWGKIDKYLKIVFERSKRLQNLESAGATSVEILSQEQTFEEDLEVL